MILINILLVTFTDSYEKQYFVLCISNNTPMTMLNVNKLCSYKIKTLFLNLQLLGMYSVRIIHTMKTVKTETSEYYKNFRLRQFSILLAYCHIMLFNTIQLNILHFRIKRSLDFVETRRENIFLIEYYHHDEYLFFSCSFV